MAGQDCFETLTRGPVVPVLTALRGGVLRAEPGIPLGRKPCRGVLIAATGAAQSEQCPVRLDLAILAITLGDFLTDGQSRGTVSVIQPTGGLNPV